MGDDRNASYMTLTDDAGNMLYRWEVDGSSGYAEPTDEVKKLEGKPVPELTMHIQMDMNVDVESFRHLLLVAQERLIKAYDVAKDNPAYTSVDGAVYSKDMTKLFLFPPQRTEHSSCRKE